jgi:heptosyltransferase-2
VAGANILLVSKGFFGDVVLSTPVIAALKESDPASRISVVCDPQAADLLRRDALVDEVIPFARDKEHAGIKGLRRFAAELKARNFTVAYSFQRSARTALMLYAAGIPERVGFADAAFSFLYTQRVGRRDVSHDVIRNFDLVARGLSESVAQRVSTLATHGPKAGDAFGRLRVADGAQHQVPTAVQEIRHGGAPYVVLVPGSAWETKRWDATHFRDTAHELVQQHRVKVVIAGAPNERDVCSQVADGLAGVQNLCGETSLLDLVELIRGASVVVCNDSVALHIASATQTPVVVVFCSTSPRFGFGPWGTEARILEKDGLFCKPCSRHGRRVCPNGTNACMTGVTSSQVVQAVCQLRSNRELNAGSSQLHVVHR